MRTGTQPIKLAVVDDHMIVQDGVRAMAERTEDIVFCGAAGNGEELADLLDRTQPDVVLVDLRIGVESGFALCRKIRESRPEIRVLIFTAFGDLELLEASVQAGASGYVLKDVSTRGLPDVIRHLCEHGSYFDPRLASRLVLETFGDRPPAGARRAPSERELEILRLVAAGKVNREIATELHVSPHTVKFHISRLMRELGASRRAELVRIAFDRKLI
jgi:two-component system response regulator DevR